VRGEVAAVRLLHDHTLQRTGRASWSLSFAGRSSARPAAERRSVIRHVTYAICIKCGEGKFGAFVPCLKCGFTPESPSDQARSILLSDHNADRATLDAAGAKLRAGEPLEFDEPGIAKMAAEMEEIAKHSPSGFGGCAIFMWVLIGIAVVLFAAVVCLIWYSRNHGH
jgi:hypothetical protein